MDNAHGHHKMDEIHETHVGYHQSAVLQRLLAGAEFLSELKCHTGHMYHQNKYMPMYPQILKELLHSPL